MLLYINKNNYFSNIKFKKIVRLINSNISDFDFNNIKIIECFCVNIQKQDFRSLEANYLNNLLNNTELVDINSLNKITNNNYVFITPRTGIKTSWSSKASELAHLSGFENILAIEKIKLIYWQDNKISKNNIISCIKNIRELYDLLLEEVVLNYNELKNLFSASSNKVNDNFVTYDLNGSAGYELLQVANEKLNLGLSGQELDYLMTYCRQENHKITDVELMMFAQANSEHCRHKIFNANWIIDGEQQEKSLFQMIQNTHQKTPNNTIKAYKDNGAIINSFDSNKIYLDDNFNYIKYIDQTHTVIKVETHNHPTAISPFPGAATGSGGEIRDETATGRGGQPKAGLVGFTVSNLNLDSHQYDWEVSLLPPEGMQTAKNIMLEAPVGAARFNNEFGRPNICGYFRDFCWQYEDNKYYGYHKPIMLAGGMGTIRNKFTEKSRFNEDCLVIVLGGPALLIGLGGGSASSSAADLKHKNLDYASVQRENPEMQRRCQEVINRCWQAEMNPILSIHDVGAGGLSNAIPELINDSSCGAILELEKIPTDDYTMSPLEIWCNEAQERYVLVIAQSDLERFNQYCMRENCPYAVLGKTTKESLIDNRLILNTRTNFKPIDLSLAVLFDNTPKIIKKVDTLSVVEDKLNLGKLSKAYSVQKNKSEINLKSVCERVLRHPTVASKQYLITIGDRSVGGLVARDQMVGSYQVPVADCAVTLTDFDNLDGEAMAIGERTPLAIINPQAAARIAVAEAVTNLLSADITKLSDVKLSANWMVASGEGTEDLALYNSVKAIGEKFCPELNLAIPVGKDSMSMRTKWQNIQVKSPVSLIISAFAPVENVNKTLTPELKLDKNTEIWLIDLAENMSLSSSIYSQVTHDFLIGTGDVEENNASIDINSEKFKRLVNCILELKSNNLLLAYHDRSDGGLWACLCEMAFTAQCGININLNKVKETHEFLFNESIGVVVQIDKSNLSYFKAILASYNLLDRSTAIASVNTNEKVINIYNQNQLIYSDSFNNLYKNWLNTTYCMQQLRNNPESAEQEFTSLIQNTNKLNLTYDFEIKPKVFQQININSLVKRSKAAILREQGTNGHVEMAAALMRAGFDCTDVHMNDIILAGKDLSQFNFLAVCGGFSYGDVLGAGRGWAARILYHENAKQVFTDFFNRPDTLTLGVCNGCQMLSHLKEIIPGAKHFPEFVHNTSEQFEARLSAVKIKSSNSVLLYDMAGSILPIVVSHGEGKINCSSSNDKLESYTCLQFVDYKQEVTMQYPANPNGSIDGITGLCTEDGRVTIMMPHPERVFRSTQLSWCPEEWLKTDDSPWMRMFYNARLWFEK